MSILSRLGRWFKDLTTTKRTPFRKREQHWRKLVMEELEDRLVPAYLFIDYGVNFPSGTLVTTQGAFRDVADDPTPGNKILGTELDSTTTFNAGTQLNIVAQSFTATERAQLLAAVQRAYLPLDVTVVELTASAQPTADGRNVAGAASMTDVINTLRAGNASSKDAYVFVATFVVDPGGANEATHGPGGGGNSPGSPTLGVASDLASASNGHDDVAAVFSDGGFSFNTLNNISHEAGHLFGLRHAITNAAASVTTNLFHQAEIMSYQGTNVTPSTMFTRYPMIRGDGNSPASPPGPVDYNDLAARNGQVTLYDQMRLDANILPNRSYSFVSGTGAHDIITITRNGSNADVAIQAFADSSYFTPITVPGEADTTYSYSIPLTNTILVYAGGSNDRIVVDGDLGVDVQVDGMLGTDTLIVNGKGAATAVYTPNATAPAGVDLNLSYGGTVTIGGRSIRFNDFETTSTVTIQNVNTLTQATPASGVDNLTLLPSAGQGRIQGTVNGGVTMVPLLFTNLATLNITPGDGNDSLSLNGNLSPTAVTNISVDGEAGASDSFNVFSLNISGNFTATAESIGMFTMTVGGNLVISSANALNDSGVLTVTGTSSFSTTATNSSITLNSSNAFTGAVMLNPNGSGNATLINVTTALNLGTSTVGGNLQVAASGAITQSGVLTVAGTTSLRVNVANTDILLDTQANNFSGIISLAGTVTNIQDFHLRNVNGGATIPSLVGTTLRDLTLIFNNVPVALPALTLTRDLNVTAGGAITDNGNLSIAGTTSLTAGAANNITLDNANNFGGAATVVSANNVTLNDTGAITLEALTVSGNLAVTAAGTVSGSGVLTISGTTTIIVAATSSDVLVGTQANNFTGGVTVTNNGNVRDFSFRNISAGATVPPLPTNLRNLTIVLDNAGVALPALTLTGDLAVTAGGVISESGNLSIPGTTSLTAGGANHITLDNVNDFGGAVTVVSGNNVTLNDTGAITLAASTVSGNLVVTAVGLINISGNLTISGGVNIVADDADIASTINAGTSTVSFIGRTSGRPINLGTATGGLDFTNAEMNNITAGTLQIGDANSGAITVSADIVFSSSINLALTSGDDVVLSGGQINTAGGALLLDAGASPKAVKPTKSGVDASANVSIANALTINIDGATVDAGFTQLNVNGTVDLANVDLILTGNYIPNFNDVFTIVSASNLVNSFNSSSMLLFNGQILAVNYTATTVTLSMPPAVVSIVRANANPSNASSLDFTVNFSENVNGVDASDFSLTANGVTGASITNVTGSNATYTVTVNTGNGEGTLGLNLVDNDSIVDANSNALIGTGVVNGNFTGPTYTIEKTLPTVTIMSTAASPTKTAPIPMTVTFSENVSGFTLSALTISNGSASNLAGSGSTYTFDLAPSGQGTVTVDLPANMAQDNASNGNSAASQFSITYDSVAPTVLSIVRANSNPNNAANLDFTVTFSENVSGVDATDFSLAASGVTGATINRVTGSNALYTVTVGSGGDDGTLGLNLVDNDSIVDAANNMLGGTGAGNGNVTGPAYTIDRGPTATITSSASSQTNISPIPMTVTFSESVTGFALTDLTLANGTASNLVGSGSNYTFDLTPSTQGLVTVNLAANLVQDNVGNGNLVASQFSITYDIEAPTVLSIIRTNSNPNNAASLDFTVTFSENVSGVDASDFSLVASGVTGAAITNINGSNASYLVTVNSGSDDGTLGLNLVDNDSIRDAASNVLGGAGAGNGNTMGQAYSIDRAPTVVITSTTTSPTNRVPIPMSVTFSESVTGFVLTDLTIGNGTASNFTGSGSSYTFDLIPTVQGAVTVDLPANVVQDSVSNGNIVASQFSIVANYPFLGGITASQAITDISTITPFSAVTIADLNTQNLTVTITYPATNGTFNTGSFSGSAGSYSFTGSASAAQTAVRALVFTPTPNQVAVGSTVTTSFTLTVNNGVRSVADSQTMVVATSVMKATTSLGKDVATSFNAADQTISLAGSVASNFGLINEGTLTFTVRDGSGNLIGTPVTSGTLVNGQASAAFSLPGGTPVGTYQITTAYSGGAFFLPHGESSKVLTVAKAATITEASKVAVTFAYASKVVQLSAMVTSGGGTVNEGRVTFQVNNSSGQPIADPVISGIVTNGQAQANVTLPGGLAVASYQIVAAYGEGTNFDLGSDSSRTLIVARAPTTPEGTSTAISFHSADQPVPLKAKVTSDSSPVNGGTVTFTIRDKAGKIIGKPIFSGEVVEGQAQASYVLPGGTPIGTYAIAVVYNGGKNFFASREDAKTLTIAKGPSTTLTKNVTLTFKTQDQKIALGATVSSKFGLVNEGAVTFVVQDGSGKLVGNPVTSGTVTRGRVGASFTLPGGTPAGTYQILATYSGGATATVSSDTSKTLKVNLARASTVVKSAAATFNASEQTLVLATTVTSRSGPINEGTVTFTVLDRFNKVVGQSVTSQPVVNGQAQASWTLPAGTPVARYKIVATFSSPNFASITARSTLKVNKAV